MLNYTAFLIYDIINLFFNSTILYEYYTNKLREYEYLFHIYNRGRKQQYSFND